MLLIALINAWKGILSFQSKKPSVYKLKKIDYNGIMKIIKEDYSVVLTIKSQLPEEEFEKEFVKYASDRYGAHFNYSILDCDGDDLDETQYYVVSVQYERSL